MAYISHCEILIRSVSQFAYPDPIDPLLETRSGPKIRVQPVNRAQNQNVKRTCGDGTTRDVAFTRRGDDDKRWTPSPTLIHFSPPRRALPLHSAPPQTLPLPPKPSKP